MGLRVPESLDGLDSRRIEGLTEVVAGLGVVTSGKLHVPRGDLATQPCTEGLRLCTEVLGYLTGSETTRLCSLLALALSLPL